MKRKILSILFALVLVLGFSLVPAIPASAAVTGVNIDSPITGTPASIQPGATVPVQFDVATGVDGFGDIEIKIYQGTTVIGTRTIAYNFLAAGNNDLTYDVDISPTAEDRSYDLRVRARQPQGTGEWIFDTEEDAVVVDTQAPIVVSATAAPALAAPGTVTVTVVFNELMDTGVSPTVEVTGLTTDPYAVSKTGYTDDTWTGEFTLLDEDEMATATISVTGAKDVAGNVMVANTAAGTFAVDSVEPEVVVAFAVPDPAAPGTVTVTVIFNEAMDTGVSPTVEVTGLTTDPYAVSKTGYTDDTWTGEFTLLDEDEMATATISVADAADVAGNVMDDNLTAGTFGVDSVEPVVTISIDDDPITAANMGAVGVTINSGEDGIYEYTISDGTTDVTGTDAITAGVPVVLSLDLSSLDDGPITADASVTDAAGNEGVAAQDTATKEATAPVVTIDIDADYITEGNMGDVLVTITSDEDGDYDYTVSDGTNILSGEGAITGGTPVELHLDLSAFDEGTITADASVEDAVGNVGVAPQDTAIKDTVLPDVTISIEDPINTGNVGGVGVTITSDEDGTCEFTISDGTNVVEATVGIEAGVPVELSLDLASLVDGPITADASVEDAAGNTGVATQDTATKDTVAPFVTISIDDPITAENETAVGVFINSDEDGTYEYTISDGVNEITGAGDITGGVVVELSLDLSTLDDGTITADASVSDAAGNTTAATQDTATKGTDTTPPSIDFTWIGYPTRAESARPGEVFVVMAVVTDDTKVTLVELETPFGTFELEPEIFEGVVFYSFVDVPPKLPSDIEPGVYELTLTAYDAAGHETIRPLELTVVASLTAFNVWMADGWNLISLPLIPDDPDIHVVLNGLSFFGEDIVRAIWGDEAADGMMPQINAVWYYDASGEYGAAGDWLYFEPATGAGDLTEIEDGKGYWVDVVSEEGPSAILTVHGVELKSGPLELPPRYLVVEGWNLVGFKETIYMPFDLYLSAVEGKYARIYGYDAYGHFPYLVGPGGRGEMSPGSGYWIYMTASGYIVP